MPSTKPILVVGEINVDWVLGGCTGMPAPDTEVLAENLREVPGSSSMICAMGLVRLGDRVAFAGCAGDDARGALCIRAMQQAGIDTAAVRLDATLATGVTVALSAAGDRALVTFPGSIAAFEAAEVGDGLLASARHLHVSSFFLQHRLRPHLRPLFTRARAAGLSISLDPGFDPEQRWGDGDEWRSLLQQVDVFLPNRREACAIARRSGVEAALDALANGFTRTIVKCAEQGCVTLDDAGAVLRVPTHRTAGVYDSTGAGDSFNAGLLHAWLANLPLRDCLGWGNACGSLSMRGLGGTECQPEADEVRAWIGARA